VRVSVGIVERGITRGVHAGRAVERIHLKSAIVGEHQFAGNAAAVFDGFDQSVLLHGRAALDRRRSHGSLRQQLDLQSVTIQ